ncbi:Rod1p [Sugiyamaella lignohabitans]|uniref:Rod1p n=1 Tax=Sugiyamaella lignohabitans TaxID=796027 RepID=A0A167D1T7_9ASCO|nr:Rod1p [Sugiyamaella lignohabitans]ANB12374.1 Rod1p [Sugiyamaella lignohabitans]
MNWIDGAMGRGTISKPVRYEAVLFDHEWDNLENGGGGLSRSRNGSSVSLSSSFGASGSAGGSGSGSGSAGIGSHGPGSGGTNTPSNNNAKTLSAGNHELPFEMVIPGDTPESIEGLEGAQMVYRLVAVVERGRFQNNLVARKHIRIVRTIGSDNFELSQTVSISNTWPSKIDYTIEIPSKAVAVGSSFPVNFTLVPMLKGLKLGNIKAQLVEFVTLATPSGSTSSSEKIRHELVIPAPEGGLEGQDSWEVNEMIQLPTSLSKCTQDCVVGQYIKVAHKIKFAVCLVNPDGHVSELRASLPIYLFISPNVPISSLDPTILQIPGSSRQPEEEILFSNASSREASSTALNSLDGGAPPNYEDHVYDRLWNGIPTPSLESPEGSVASTPRLRSRRNSLDHDHLMMTALDPAQRSQLAAGLRALELQQQASSGSQTPGVGTNHSSASQSGDNSRTPSGANTPHFGPSDYFSHGSHFSPEISHLSRVGTPVLTPRTPDIDINLLSKVPSYSTAVRDGNASDGEWAPDYEPGNGPSSTSPPLTMPSLAHLSSTPGNSLRRGIGSAGSSHVNSHSSSSLALNTLAHGHHSGSHSASHSGNHTGHHSSNGSGNISRSSSSTGLSFMHRNGSSRSLFDEASRLIRLTSSDKAAKRS